MPPEKVPAAVESFARGGGMQVLILSAKLGGFLLFVNFSSAVASTCLQAGISHLIARLLGSRDTFRATAAAYAYGSAAWMLSIIPIISPLAPIYGAVLDIIAMQRLHQLSLLRAIVAVTTGVAIPIFALMCYSCMSSP